MGRREALPCSWIGIINIVKMAILPIYRFNAKPYQHSNEGFQRSRGKIQELTENRKKPQLARAILTGEHSRGITISKLKLLNTILIVRAIKTAWGWQRDSQV